MAYEALFGNLPSEQQPDRTHRFRAWAPLLLRGAANAPESRFPSLGELIAALDQAAARPLPRAALAIAGSTLVVAAVAAAYLWGSGKQPPKLSRWEVEKPATRSTTSAPASSNSAASVEYLARRAAEKMNHGQWQECLNVLQENPGSAFLSAMQVDCARKVSSAELRTACKQHKTSFGDLLDGCTETDLQAFAHKEKGDYPACVRALYALDWSSQRNILLTDCAFHWNTKEAFLLSCRYAQKSPDSPINATKCPSAEEFGVVFNEIP
jgi:hypothetical protein